VSQSDPTDNALAAIASILDQPEARREPERRAVEEKQSVPPPLPSLAEADTPVETHTPVEPLAPVEAPAPVQSHAPIEAHGYSKVGPGPMAAIRFRWTVRVDQGEYYVDETIGENSRPIVTGPMGREAAVEMVDAREADARHRFEQLKSEMIGRGSAANFVQKDGGEA
jgi:hypothetical protein